MKGLPVINVVNMGDVETPVKIEFQGPATNPKIENRTTGEYIQVQRNLSLGDTLLLTTDFGAKRVEINGVNAFHYIDLNSVFWQLRPGDNIVEYSSDEPTEPAAVVISYRNRYVGRMAEHYRFFNSMVDMMCEHSADFIEHLPVFAMVLIRRMAKQAKGIARRPGGGGCPGHLVFGAMYQMPPDF